MIKTLPKFNPEWLLELRERAKLYAAYKEVGDKLERALKPQHGKRFSKHIENAVNKKLAGSGLEVRLRHSYSWWELTVYGSNCPEGFPSLNLGYDNHAEFDHGKWVSRECYRFQLWLDRAQEDARVGFEIEPAIDKLGEHLKLVAMGIKYIEDRQGVYGSILSAVLKKGD